MEIKATLAKPYSEEERINFIVEQNHRNGFEIRETETALEAWGSDDTEKLVQAKATKYAENSTKANVKLSEGVFTLEINSVTIRFVYDDSTKNDLNASAIGFVAGVITEKEWTDEDGNTVMLKQADVANMLLMLESWGNPIWAKWGIYKKQIDEAETLSEVEDILINYDEEEEEE